MTVRLLIIEVCSRNPEKPGIPCNPELRTGTSRLSMCGSVTLRRGCAEVLFCQQFQYVIVPYAVFSWHFCWTNRIHYMKCGALEVLRGVVFCFVLFLSNRRHFTGWKTQGEPLCLFQGFGGHKKEQCSVLFYLMLATNNRNMECSWFLYQLSWKSDGLAMAVNSLKENILYW